MNTTVAAYATTGVKSSDVSHLALFRGANLSLLEPLLNICPVLPLPAGQTLIVPGQPNQVLYLLLDGRLRVQKDALDSESVGTIEPGESVNLFSGTAQTPLSLHVVAVQDSHLLALDDERLLEFIDHSHAVSRNLLLVLMEGLREQGAAESQRKCLQQKYRRTSSVDELTGLHNRHWLEQMLTRQILRSSTAQQALSLILASVDRFGEFQDEFGQALGDQALYVIAQTLMNSLRPTDLIARYAGNTFAMILPATDLDGARHAAARLREVVSDTEIVVPKECVLPPLTISLGLAQLKAFVAAEALLADTRAALARAKAAGGNWVAE